LIEMDKLDSDIITSFVQEIQID